MKVGAVEQQSKTKHRKTWIIVAVAAVAAIATALVAVFVFHLPFGDTQAEAEQETTSEVTPSTTDPMEVIKNYEQFMMDYADYAEMLNSQDGIPADKAEGYAEWLKSFDDINAQFEAVSDTELTPEQEAYFDEVIDRVDQRMREATGSELAGIPRSAEEAEEQYEARKAEADRTAGRISDEDASAE
ncbi:putative chemotaxis sensory transducer [Bifidobacterium cuniculi]|uniref:Putative chemotaxis sensory transducer n=1 Tax=Bifidobacterium cuniculi TaxID=1688 RepID=A0A087AT48_9BIFI|nr:putative chemotaxis sensory transducer [Bifidobacterium cuniculi]